MFHHCKTIEDLKTEYRRLAKLHHPDKGGNPGTFSRIEQAMRKRQKELENPSQTDIPNFLTPEITEKLMTIGFQLIDDVVISLKEKLMHEITKPGKRR
jgi:hypothetical protein